MLPNKVTKNDNTGTLANMPAVKSNPPLISEIVSAPRRLTTSIPKNSALYFITNLQLSLILNASEKVFVANNLKYEGIIVKKAKVKNIVNPTKMKQEININRITSGPPDWNIPKIPNCLNDVEPDSNIAIVNPNTTSTIDPIDKIIVP